MSRRDARRSTRRSCRSDLILVTTCVTRVDRLFPAFSFDRTVAFEQHSRCSRTPNRGTRGLLAKRATSKLCIHVPEDPPRRIVTYGCLWPNHSRGRHFFFPRLPDSGLPREPCPLRSADERISCAVQENRENCNAARDSSPLKNDLRFPLSPLTIFFSKRTPVSDSNITMATWHRRNPWRQLAISI